ncbi:GAF domain-containing protein [Mucilaginibacter xinganensis]|uniref:GAF domain-containing protein n=1 Tax=Mucilaginibacter xinganensis TaxID=1234841 RepID=A0A223NZ87_9SPHI|nr:GAF domain-containing protein [Mucilaginibacter xinganensis]ASU35090.1 GAF domain-containing protein [Mucilaginibacter xinganensis]
MLFPQFSENPFQIKLSFHKIIERLEEIAAGEPGINTKKAAEILTEVAPFPELRDGIESISQIADNELVIAHLLQDLFPEILSKNEIKAVSIPYLGLIFNYTERFKDIIKAAGTNFDFNIRDFDEHQFYVMSCCIILNQFYGTHLDFGKPLFYDIPAADGIIKHYRILYNADFLEIIPTEKSSMLTKEDIDLLMDNYDDLDLWKEKFPPNSWILKGFGIMTLFDATVENAVSSLKSNLLGNKSTSEVQENLETIFRSIFKIPDLHIGFTAFDKENDKFVNTSIGQKIKSYMLEGKTEADCQQMLRADTYQNLIKKQTPLAITDLPEFVSANPESKLSRHFSAQDVQSFILAPIVKNGALLGILELVSKRTRDLNSVNAKKLEIVMPFLVDTIYRKVTELQNQIEAVIQQNYTTLHPSVNWKFRDEALKYIRNKEAGKPYHPKEIAFQDVYPLYGQIDIKNSSITRNLSVANDLISQLQQVILLLEQMHQEDCIVDAAEKVIELKEFLNDLDAGLKADTEHFIQNYIETTIHPILTNNKKVSKKISDQIDEYFKRTDKLTGDFYANRRNYETTLTLINEKLISIIDSRQTEAQVYFPHYYERFKTDGVEHNLYIGKSISPTQAFEPAHLEHLRLWQLLVLCEMEAEQYRLKKDLPIQLGVTSLILIFSTPIAIRFRMDEKHFDIDGAYNIRYEVIKKRIDKAFIKGTKERITKQNRITIIFSKPEEETEYMKLINLLQDRGILGSKIEEFELEDLQGVSGLKALRVSVIHNSKISAGIFDYEETYKQLNAAAVEN